MVNKNKAISEVLAMLLMIVIVVGLIGVVYFFISGMVARQTAGVLQVGGAYCNIANSRLEVLVTNVGTTTIPASDIKVFVGGNLIQSIEIKQEDKQNNIPNNNIDPGMSFWVLINDVGGGNAPKAGKTYRGQVVYAGKAVDFIIYC
ncbi:MAG: archaellin/type IV pilin N-terminal domain-containing protein [Candidatus Aenigmatarchaeota archaeon]